MKWNYIFASCLIAALLLDQTSAVRPFGSRSRSSSRSSGSSRSSSSSRSPSPLGSPSSYRPPSTQVTHYDPANSHFTRAQSPSPGQSTSSAGSSRRPSHLPLSHSSSTSSGYVSLNSPHSPHQLPPGSPSSSSIPINPFQKLQYTSHREPSPPRSSPHGHHSPSVPPPHEHHSSSIPSTPGHHPPTKPSYNRPRSPTRPPASGHQSRPEASPRTDRNPRLSLNALERLEFEASLAKSFITTHQEVLFKDETLKLKDKRNKQLAVKKVSQKVLDAETKKKKAQDSKGIHRKTLDDVSLVRDKNKKCGHQGSTTESCFDYYAFAMSWAPSGVRTARKLKGGNLPREDKWLVHGLWPNVRGNLPAPPKACDVQKMPFDLRKLHGIKHELENNWYSVVSDNEVFWQHEWEKHGACAARSIFINDIEGYFKKALALRKTLRIGEILHQAGFVPGSKMTLQQIYDTITQHYSTPEIVTWKDVANDVIYLKEIRICLNHRFKYMSCPMKPPHSEVLAQEIPYLSITEVS